MVWLSSQLKCAANPPLTRLNAMLESKNAEYKAKSILCVPKICMREASNSDRRNVDTNVAKPTFLSCKGVRLAYQPPHNPSEWDRNQTFVLKISQGVRRGLVGRKRLEMAPCPLAALEGLCRRPPALIAHRFLACRHVQPVRRSAAGIHMFLFAHRWVVQRYSLPPRRLAIANIVVLTWLEK